MTAWMMSTRPTRCIMTGATFESVQKNLYAPLRKMVASSRIRLPGKMGVSQWQMDDPTCYLRVMSADRPESMQGVHADVVLPEHYKLDEETEEQDRRRAERDPLELIAEEVDMAKKLDDKVALLFVFDEAYGIPAPILDTALGSMMGKNTFACAQLNPTFSEDDGHPAAKWLQPDSGWHRIHVAGRPPPEDLHNAELFDECFHNVPHELMPEDWYQQRIADTGWGPRSSMTMAHVYGMPSNVERDYQFIPFHILQAQFDRLLKDDGRPESRHVGWDVAGSDNGDLNVAQLWVCGGLVDEDQWRDANTTNSKHHVMQLMQKWGRGDIPWRNLHVDATGGSMGKAIADQMRHDGMRIDAVDFGAEARGDWVRLVGPEMYFKNRKAELLWVLRCALQKGLAHIPRKWSDTVRQAQWYSYREVPHAAGTQLVCRESKDDLREMYKRSPDNLEAATLAWSRSGRGPMFMATNNLGDIGRRLGR